MNADILTELIGLITCEPSPELEEKARYRLPHIAAEILSCEISHINEKVSSDPVLLNQLYSFIEQEPPLNPLLSSYFSKAFNQLITRKSEQVRKSPTFPLKTHFGRKPCNCIRS